MSLSCPYGLAEQQVLKQTTLQSTESYIDDRVARRPYPNWAIMRAVKVLKLYLEVMGWTDADMKSPDFHNCGIF